MFGKSETVLTSFLGRDPDLEKSLLLNSGQNDVNDDR